MCTPMIKGANKSAHRSWEEGVYGLPSLLEVASFLLMALCLCLALVP